MDQTFAKYVALIRSELLDQAESAMRFPKKEPFDHGVQVGVWQGLELAHQILESVLNDQQEIEARR